MAKFAFDYDGTISDNFGDWYYVMGFLQSQGHEVFVVTFRDERHDRNSDLTFLEEDNFDVYYTRGVAKRWWCEQFGPGKVDVWIDDKPEAILNNSNYTVDDLHVWREECKIAASA